LSNFSKTTRSRDSWAEEGDLSVKVCTHRGELTSRRNVGQPLTYRSVRQLSRVTGFSSRLCSASFMKSAFSVWRSDMCKRWPNRTQLLDCNVPKKSGNVPKWRSKLGLVHRHEGIDPRCVPSAIRKKQVVAERLLRTWTTFSWSASQSSASRIWSLLIRALRSMTSLWYRDVLLLQKLTPVIHQVSEEFFIFQQDNTPTHRARDTVRSTSGCWRSFHDPWPPNNPTTPRWAAVSVALCHCPAVCLHRVFTMSTNWSNVWWTFDTVWSRWNNFHSAINWQVTWPSSGQRSTFRNLLW